MEIRPAGQSIEKNIVLKKAYKLGVILGTNLLRSAIVLGFDFSADLAADMEMVDAIVSGFKDGIQKASKLPAPKPDSRFPPR